MSAAPGYWMYETTGVLRPAVEAYLKPSERGCEMTPQQIATMRAYLRQWIMAGVWDMNPHAGAAERAWLAAMRDRIEALNSRAAIERWLNDALEAGIDPL